jgi:periplasmic divalent cation tolerance protein
VSEANGYLVVLTTWPEEGAAREAAGQWVQQGLAACVNVMPMMTSIYPWKGEIETGTEHLLLIKTRRSVYPRLEAAIQQSHPYELPEILALPAVAGLSGYLQWIDECTQ